MREYWNLNYCIICQNQHESKATRHTTEKCDYLGRCSKCRSAEHETSCCDDPNATKRCHNCGAEGHYSKNCPAKEPSCWHCGARGHRRDSCPYWRLNRKELEEVVIPDYVPPHEMSTVERREYEKAKARRMEWFVKNQERYFSGSF